MLWIITGIIVSYLVGSIPSAYILGRLIKGIDIRKFGSGNVGATNAFRVLGSIWGLTAFCLDVAKGLLPVLFVADLLMPKGIPVSENLFRIILGLASVCGHNWTIFLRFKGGKGIATSLGVLLGLALRISGFGIIIGLAIAIWTVVFFIFKIVSLASIICALLLPVLAAVFRQPTEIIFFTLLLSLFAVIRHIPNIKRLLRGEEKPLKKTLSF